MGRRRVFLRALAAALLAAAAPAAAALETAAGRLEVTAMATGLDEPWGLAFLPGGGFLVTERGGRLLHFPAGGGRVEVAGLPEIAVAGQGGLLDVMVPRDFAARREVFLTFAAPQGQGSGTALGVGRLADDGARLENFRVLFAMAPGHGGGRHFGSRVLEAPDGSLIVTLGDRGTGPSGLAAQDLGDHAGKVIRLARDGAVPPDNPFVATPGALPEIWSLGHRNPQGAAFDAEGRLWVSEHGARGGDEINLVEPGRNYG
jgi:glucose/arabinose dehydrogenase